MVVPTVSLLYLFCFIDRANIGMDHALKVLPIYQSLLEPLLQGAQVLT
jgi:hypothetical protein